MIPAKEKAKELLEKMYDVMDIQDGDLWKSAKECAIIAVDEMLEEISKWAGGEFQEWEKERWKYLQEVKQEIELL